MGIRFRKSFKIAPGVRMNLGKKSASLSLGGKGFHTTVSSSGRRTHTVGIPGTGISHVSTSGGHSQHTRHSGATHQKPASRLLLKVCSVIMTILGIISVLLAIVAFSTAGSAGLLFVIFAIPIFYFAWLFNPAKKQNNKP